jgi:hypothetical protein
MAQISFSDLVNGIVPDASDFNDRFNALKNRINNGMEQDNLSAGSVTTAKIVNGSVTAEKIDQTDDFTWTGEHDFTGATVTGAYTATAENALTGSAVQVVNIQTGDVATGTTLMPLDNSTPLYNEGDEFMTLSITPKSATNILKIDVVFNFSGSAANPNVTIALFKDPTGSDAAIAAVGKQSAVSSDRLEQLILTHYMIAGGVAETTFKVRAGSLASNTISFNGAITPGTRVYGGICASSITITEIKAS